MLFVFEQADHPSEINEYIHRPPVEDSCQECEMVLKLSNLSVNMPPLRYKWNDTMPSSTATLIIFEKIHHIELGVVPKKP